MTATPHATIDRALTASPVVAILRGIRTGKAPDIVEALYRAGVRIAEIPLNSPDPFKTISVLAKAFEGRMVIGAGTVLTPENVERVAEAGGTICVAPNTDTSVITRSLALGLEPMPGFQTPTEAFMAINAGARILKMFPCGSTATETMTALSAVLPEGVRVLAVGGVSPQTVGTMMEAGFAGLGVGSAVYKPGLTADEVASRAQRLMEAVRAWQTGAAASM